MTLLYVPNTQPENHYVTRRLLLAGLGFVFLAAFWSLWVQVIGLIGESGIVPSGFFLKQFAEERGIARLWELPTWQWIIGTGDWTLHFLCAVGVLGAIAMMAGLAPTISAFVCWSAYLSLYAAAPHFLSFQWDILLLEAGFLAFFLAPPFAMRLAKETPPPSVLIIWLYRFLIFKLTFSSGVVKLSGGDVTWRDLTALSYHYETTCLPAWTGWLMHQMPMWFHKVSALGMFAIELIVPFGIFLGRLPRIIAAVTFTGLMVFIGLTGNYGFFNLLTIVLCIPLLCDELWPAALRARYAPEAAAPPAWPDDVEAREEAPAYNVWGVPWGERRWPRPFLIGLTVVVLLCNIVPMIGTFRPLRDVTGPLAWIHRVQSPFHIASRYGLFARMTTQRPEIIFEASMDGEVWHPYELPYKPGDRGRRPGLYGLHMPRLDWLLWFAALGDPRRDWWTSKLAYRLLTAEPAVLDLFERVPFKGERPRYVRALLYDYHFTDWSDDSGSWWRRELISDYLPALELRPDGQVQLVR